jgi:fatty-acyl-CoA synthase
MMRSPLTLTPLFERAGRLFPRVEIVSQRPDNSTHRYTYGDWYRRVLALAAALQALGVRPGDRVATLMWNHYAHLEAYFAVPVIGGVLHTLNLRLPPDELAYIVNHAEDRCLIVDDVLLPLFEQIKDRVNVERVVVVSFGGGAPSSHGYEDYEQLLERSDGFARYADLDEDDALGICYTSGTTGRPKGVVYSHRAIALHSYSISLPDSFAISRRDTVLPAMSMFHANAWGMPFAAAMNGSRLVLPGPNLQPEAILDLLSANQVTLTGAVPTVWLGVIDALEEPDRGAAPRSWWGLRVSGDAVPPLDRFGVRLFRSGVTGTSQSRRSHLKPHVGRSGAERYGTRQARAPVPFIEIRAMGDDGEAPWDGETPGELEVRGPFVASGYYKQPADDRWTGDGWLRTGDVATIDSEGCVKITDRTKDLFKSGGEWISSVDVENALVAHPAVAEAAVIAVPHPKWQERPLAVVVLKPGRAAGKQELRRFLAKTFAQWQLPDDFVCSICPIPAGSCLVGPAHCSGLNEQPRNRELVRS